MLIQEAATKIISCWEHGGRYDCHGNGAYGLIGWQGEQLTILLDAYVEAGGRLMYLPKSYSHALLTVHQNGELNEVADDPLMRATQLKQAHHYMTKAIRIQQQHYPFKTALAQLVLCDMGVNNGLNNNYVIHCGADLQNDSEAYIIGKAQAYRIHVMKDEGVWQKYEGIRRRYEFYQGMVSMAVPINSWRPVAINVNGIKADLGGEAIEPLLPQ